MNLKNYYNFTQHFLREFESAQLNMLRLHLNSTLPRMNTKLESFLQLLKSVKEELGEIDKKSEDFIIMMRIDLLVMHIDIILQVLGKLDTYNINPFEIIRIFDKQHVFKNVLRSHLEDLESRLRNDGIVN